MKTFVVRRHLICRKAVLFAKLEVGVTGAAHFCRYISRRDRGVRRTYRQDAMFAVAIRAHGRLLDPGGCGQSVNTALKLPRDLPVTFSASFGDIGTVN